MPGTTFFNRRANIVATALLGQELVHTLPDGRVLSGLVVETEAYFHENDPAAHSARGETHATRALRMGPGTLYIHPMRAYVGLDIVTRKGSVLLRALQPQQGLPSSATVANGPGKLCHALGITKHLYGLNITNPGCPLQLQPHPPIPPANITITPRIGITKNTEALLRFSIQHSKYLSKPA